MKAEKRNPPRLRVSWLGDPEPKLQKTFNLAAADWQNVPGSEGVTSVGLSLNLSALFFRLLRP